MRLSDALRALAVEDAAMSGAGAYVEERLRAEVRAVGQRRSRRRGVVDALAIAAALTLAVGGAARLRRTSALEPAAVAVPEVATAFVPLPYSSVPVSNGVIVRLELPRAALASLGFAPADAVWSGTTVTADVIVGDDGLARAIRFVRAARKESR